MYTYIFIPKKENLNITSKELVLSENGVESLFHQTIVFHTFSKNLVNKSTALFLWRYSLERKMSLVKFFIR